MSQIRPLFECVTH